mmetsp:Transcript_55096/g.131295  ORF Transcript_55096/g.131295 Transcript_55096/m.131295 type:complete len:917 (-) Transcript_55096:84-2834(-)
MDPSLAAPFSRLLRAIGVEQEQVTGQSRRPAAQSARGASDPLTVALPDLAEVAAATEQGVLILEQEASQLATFPPTQVLETLRSWNQELRRKPPADGNLASSFRVQFLRSNALEKSLQCVRGNVHLKRLIMAGIWPEEIAQELEGLLIATLPRGCGSTLPSFLQTALGGSEEAASAVVTAVRGLKEDWREAVRSQAIRILQVKLDSATYALQKQPSRTLTNGLTTRTSSSSTSTMPAAAMGKDSSVETVASQIWRRLGSQVTANGRGAKQSIAEKSMQEVAYQHIAVLASMCEAIDEAASRVQTRKVEVREVMKEVRRRLGQAPADSSDAASLRDGSSGDCPDPSQQPGTSALDELDVERCEAAVEAIVQKTTDGIQEGLRLLGLPTEPLIFVPGERLELCGQSLREEISSLAACWLEDDRVQFQTLLRQLQDRLRRADDRLDNGSGKDAPAPSDPEQTTAESSGKTVEALGEERDSLRREHASLLTRLRAVETRMTEIEAQLPLHLREAPPDYAVASERLAGGTKLLSDSAFVQAKGGSTQASGSTAATVIDIEMSKAQERLEIQLHLRRVQLLTSLCTYLRSEREWLMTCEAEDDEANSGSDLAWERALELCGRVKRALGSHIQVGLSIGRLGKGTRCLAKWLDGNYYDAEVQAVLADGTISVNWLRPRPDAPEQAAGEGTPIRRALVTVSERGGDDTQHRLLQFDDLRFIDLSVPASDIQAAQDLFAARASEDRQCIDCGSEKVEWASVSFGTYLCASCAQQQTESVSCRLLVKELGDGRGWQRWDLEYMKKGGNQLFQASCSEHHVPGRGSKADMYRSRFAEYYRRQLEALCVGLPLPPPPGGDANLQASPQSRDMLGLAEAAACVEQELQGLEAMILAFRVRQKPGVRVPPAVNTSRSSRGIALPRFATTA